MNINEVPKYIMHSDGNGEDDKTIIIDSGTASLSFQEVDDGININNKLYYSADKVNELLSALKNELQRWVASNYQHK